MKTAQKILLTALTLFNEHGENTVTSVDIAIELDISPGNLYYHFKGKDSLVNALMKMHEQQMQKILKGHCISKGTSTLSQSQLRMDTM